MCVCALLFFARIFETRNGPLFSFSLQSWSLGKWNVISNMILMLSRDMQALKAQLADLKKQGQGTQKSLKSLKSSCAPGEGRTGEQGGGFCSFEVF